MRKVFLFTILFISSSFLLQAQDIITGKVTDSKDGSPMSGVSVRVKGGDEGVQTNADGTFRISVKSKQRILLFSFVGFATEEINAAGRSRIEISLSTEDKKLQEVVVLAYGTQAKAKVTGAIAKVEGKEVENIPMSSVDQMLQGKVAGLQSVASSGQPGALQEIRIRGIGSINASSEPLFVIDGIPANTGDFSRTTTTSNALAGLNPNDIESISVLKDASAASLYGSRAANGVILITTKKGKSGKTKITFDSEYGSSKISFLNDLAKPLTKSQYTQLTTDGLFNAGADTPTANFYLDAFGANNGFNTDWLNEVTRHGISQQYNVSASGGDSRTTFYLSGGYYKQQAVVIGSDFKRFSGDMNLRHKINDRISVGFSINASHSDQNTPTQSANFRSPVLAAYYLRPYQHPYNSDGTYDIGDDFEQIYNPVAINHYDRQTIGSTKMIGALSGEYNMLKGLKFTTRIGLDYFNLEEQSYYNPFFGDAVTRGGDFTNFYTRVFNWVWTNTLDYHKELDRNGDLTADLKVGYEGQRSTEYDISAFGSQVPQLTTLPLPPTSSPKQAIGSGNEYSFSSALSQLLFNYKNKYTLSGSFRRDGSSRFGINDRYGNFWSVGGAWNLDKENFLADSKWIAALKLRASYGVNGNANIGNYSWQPLYAFGSDYNQLPGSGPANVGNRGLNLTWEQNKPFDVGIELGLLKNRVNIEADYYIRKTSQLLQSVPLSLTSGFGSYLDNIGAMENKGFEFTVNATPVLTKDFRWDISFNVAFNKNKVTALNNNEDIIISPNLIRVGQDVQTIYTFIWAGADPQTGNGQWYTDGTRKTKTQDITQVQNAIIGSASPKGFGGLSTTLSYKGISLSAQFNYQYGNLLLNTWGFLNESDGAFFSLNQDQKEFERRWKKPGDITDVPQYVAGNQSQSNALSSRYFYKGDYIRLRNLTLGYTLPRTLLSRLKIDNAQFYVRGTNLWTHAFDKDITFDPEQPVNGINDLQILLQKTISVGLNLGF